MKKKNKYLKLSSIAALGLVAGAIAPADAQAADSSMCISPTAAQVDALFPKLDQAHRDMFNAMTCERQNIAVELANQSCAGQNSCKGKGSCKSDKNACAGQNSCKGQSKGPFTNKNTAVEAANKIQLEKRNSMMK